MKRTAARIILTAAVMLSSFSCNYRELNTVWYDTADVWIAVDWSGFTEETPTGMSVYCYPREGSHGNTPYVLLSNDISGVAAKLPAGHYDILVFNQSVDEFSTVRFEGMEHFSTGRAVLKERKVKWKTPSAGQTLAYEPEWIAVDTCVNFCVTDEMVRQTTITRARLKSADGERSSEISPASKAAAIVTLHPENVITNARVRIRIAGVNNLRSVRGSISGMSSSYILATGERDTAVVTHILEDWRLANVEADGSKGEIATAFLTFGLPGGSSPADAVTYRAPEANYLATSFLLVDNKTVCDFGFKVGDCFYPDSALALTIHLDIGYESEKGQKPSAAADPGRPPLLPDVKPEGGTGFIATVDDWAETREIDIPM